MSLDIALVSGTVRMCAEVIFWGRKLGLLLYEWLNMASNINWNSCAKECVKRFSIHYLKIKAKYSHCEHDNDIVGISVGACASYLQHSLKVHPTQSAVMLLSRKERISSIIWTVHAEWQVTSLYSSSVEISHEANPLKCDNHNGQLPITVTS